MKSYLGLTGEGYSFICSYFSSLQPFRVLYSLAMLWSCYLFGDGETGGQWFCILKQKEYHAQHLKLGFPSHLLQGDCQEPLEKCIPPSLPWAGKISV